MQCSLGPADQSRDDHPRQCLRTSSLSSYELQAANGFTWALLAGLLLMVVRFEAREVQRGDAFALSRSRFTALFGMSWCFLSCSIRIQSESSLASHTVVVVHLLQI